MSKKTLSVFDKALKECRKVGTAHATGDALRAMYAELVRGMQGGNAEIYFAHFQSNAPGNDQQVAESARELLRDRTKAWDVLLGTAESSGTSK